jgi:hypothetical protein
MKHGGRQDYLIAVLKPKITKEDFKEFLEKKGFERSILSWIDDGEILSMRKRVDERYQFHIRLFCDSEIRGHYEYAPESKPLDHLNGVVFRQRKEYFQKLLKPLM